MSKQKVTIKDIAEQAFVSRSVVSRVLNNHPDVNVETRKRVWAVIEENNYRPKSVARSLVKSQSHEICILIPPWENNLLSSSFWAILFMGLTEQCQKNGYYVSVSVLPPQIDSSERDSFFFSHDFDGYILMHREVTESAIPALKRWEVPCVVIGYDGTKDVSSIDVDNFEGGYLAGQHLVRLGHQKIGLVSGDLKRQETKDRSEGFKKALKEGGIEFDKQYLTEGEYSYETGEEALSYFISLNEPPSAVFCISDVMALGVLSAAHQHGVNVPDQLAVVGFDGLPGSAYSVPALTTVRQPIYEKGLHAIDVLIDKISNQDMAPRRIKLKPKLVVRKSCGSAQV